MFRLLLLKRSIDPKMDQEKEREALLVDELRIKFSKLTLVEEQTIPRAAVNPGSGKRSEAEQLKLGKRKKKREKDEEEKDSRKTMREDRGHEKRGKKRVRERDQEASEDEERGSEFKTRKTAIRGTTL